MAISWKVTIIPIDIPNKIVRIVAVRTDETPDAPVYTVRFHANISTSALKLEALDRIWAKYQTLAAKQAIVDVIIGDLETVAEANLEERES